MKNGFFCTPLMLCSNWIIFCGCSPFSLLITGLQLLFVEVLFYLSHNHMIVFLYSLFFSLWVASISFIWTFLSLFSFTTVWIFVVHSDTHFTRVFSSVFSIVNYLVLVVTVVFFWQISQEFGFALLHLF